MRGNTLDDLTGFLAVAGERRLTRAVVRLGGVAVGPEPHLLVEAPRHCG
jgi:hypothetical protein